VTGGWRKLHNEVLHNLYSLPSIIKMIKSRRMRLAGHVARMGTKRNAYRIKVKSKVIPVPGCGGPQGCETSRLPHIFRQSAQRRQ
jgi:hypothetical protein